MTAGIMLGARFIDFYMTGDGEGKIQSLILASIFLAVGFQTGLVALLANMIAANRRPLEDIHSFQISSINPKQQQTAPK